MTILLLDNFDSFTFNLYQMTQAQTDEPVEVIRNNAIAFDEIKGLRPAGIIISPGPGHPANPADVGVCADVLKHHNELNCPILGVCLGHQLIAHHFGAHIVHAPSVMHGKTSPVQVLQSSPMFEDMPTLFDVMRYHSLLVSPDNFPPELQITAVAFSESPEDGLKEASVVELERDVRAQDPFVRRKDFQKTPALIMALQHGTLPIYGVQFHPESIGTPVGDALLKNFITLCKKTAAV